jgi:hypothetical protein
MTSQVVVSCDSLGGCLARLMCPFDRFARASLLHRSGWTVGVGGLHLCPVHSPR